MKKNPKTPEVRAKELYKLVHGPTWYFDAQNPATRLGWLKLGALVLKLEKKFNALKK